MKIIAHRGLTSKAPENSIAALKLAMKGKFSGVEFDVRRSKDNKIYVIHDSKLDRTTNMKGRLDERTSKELKFCKLKDGEPLLFLILHLMCLKKPN